MQAFTSADGISLSDIAAFYFIGPRSIFHHCIEDTQLYMKTRKQK
uniref:Uncharacterized protein n=1 Tax=Anguilla anguilla TaxID=7936 RepID=A0A0E9XLX0_ANGAN